MDRDLVAGSYNSRPFFNGMDDAKWFEVSNLFGGTRFKCS